MYIPLRVKWFSGQVAGWSTEKLQVETEIKRWGRKALFKEPGFGQQ